MITLGLERGECNEFNFFKKLNRQIFFEKPATRRAQSVARKRSIGAIDGHHLSGTSYLSFTLSAIGSPFLLYLEDEAKCIFSSDLVQAFWRVLEWTWTARAAGACADPRLYLLYHDDEGLPYNKQHLAQAVRRSSERTHKGVRYLPHIQLAASFLHPLAAGARCSTLVFAVSRKRDNSITLQQLVKERDVFSNTLSLH